MNKDQKILVFCDGACLGNPGPGGWGYVVASENQVREGGGQESGTTNNRMELLSVIEALRLLRSGGAGKGAEIVVHCDSQYSPPRAGVSSRAQPPVEGELEVSELILGHDVLVVLLLLFCACSRHVARPC